MNNNIISTKNIPIENIADTFVTKDQLQNYQSEIHNRITHLNNNLIDIKNSTSREIKWTQKYLLIFAVLQIIVTSLFAIHLCVYH